MTSRVRQLGLAWVLAAMAVRTPAWGAPPAELELRGALALGTVRPQPDRLGGLGGHGGVQLVGPLWFEGGADLFLGVAPTLGPDGGVRALLEPSAGLRLRLSPSSRSGPAAVELSGAARVGLSAALAAVAPAPFGRLDAAVDLRVSPALAWRTRAGVDVLLTGPVARTALGSTWRSRGLLTTGLVLRWPRPVREVPVVEDPAPPALQLPAAGADGLTRVPPDFCEVSEPAPPEETTSTGSGVPRAADPFTATTPSSTATTPSSTATTPSSSASPPEPGTLLVGVRPGIVFQGADGQPLPVDAEGVVALPSDGVFSWVGAGQRGEEQVTMVPGYAHFVLVPAQLPAPEAERLRFDMGSATLRAEAAERLSELAATLGGWRVTVVGSASPEGDPRANRQLADRRAAAVAERLEALGVPASQIDLVGAVEADPGLDVVEQRAVVLTLSPPPTPRSTP